MSIRRRKWLARDGAEKSAWLVDYRDTGGVRRSKQFARKKDAEAWQTKAAYDVSQGTHTADSQSVTVQRAAETWIDACRLNDLEPTTIAAYDQHVRLHIVPLIGSKRLNHLTKPAIEEFRDALLSTRSRPMALRVLGSLSRLIGEAERRGLVAKNVCRGVRVKRQARHRSKPQIPTKPELRSILEAASRSELPMEPSLVMIALFAGLRASELRGLPWGGIDFRTGSVSILQRADNRNVIGPPKSASGFRTIPLPATALNELRKWKLRCPSNEVDLVFPSSEGTPLFYPSLVRRLIEPLMFRAGLTRIKQQNGKPVYDQEGHAVLEGKYSLHDLRHAAVSLWIEQRVDPKRVQTWAGHHSIQVTYDIYGHLFAETEGDAAVANAVEASLSATGATPMQQGA